MENVLERPKCQIPSEGKCPGCGGQLWYPYFFEPSLGDFVADDVSPDTAKAVIDYANWGEYILDVCCRCGLVLTYPGD